MKKLLVLGGVVVGFVLAALAFTFGAGWFSSSSATAQEDGEMQRERQMVIAVEEVKVINGVETVVAGEVVINFENPTGLPDRPSDVDGILKGQSGDTLLVGTGSIDVEVEVKQVNDQEPVMAVSASHSGPLVEVMISDYTVVHVETTPKPKPTQADLDAGEMTVLRSIEPGSLDDLGDDTMVQVWGIQDGETVMATVLIVSPIR